MITNTINTAAVTITITATTKSVSTTSMLTIEMMIPITIMTQAYDKVINENHYVQSNIFLLCKTLTCTRSYRTRKE